LKIVAALFFLGLFCVIGAILVLPLALAAKVEKALGGPWLRVHLPLNLAFAAWATYRLFFVPPNLHDPSPLLFVPAFMALAVFYALVFPRIAPKPTTPFRRFRVLALAAYLIAVGLFLIPLIVGELFDRS
jgi:hypothetical protein